MPLNYRKIPGETQKMTGNYQSPGVIHSTENKIATNDQKIVNIINGYFSNTVNTKLLKGLRSPTLTKFFNFSYDGEKDI